MSFAKEFREFAVKGNVVDMAVGIIIGAAFGKIVSSFVADMVMPPIGVLLGGVNFSDLAIVLQHAKGDQPEVVMAYGKFLQTIIDFLIVAMAVFVGVKVINRLKRQEKAKVAEEVKKPAPVEPPPPADDVVLLTEIRDLLKQK